MSTADPGPQVGAHPASGGSSPRSGTGRDERSLGEIVSDVTSGLGDLVRQELDLAKAELKQEAGRAGKGAGMLGGAAVGGLLLLVFLSLTLMFGLDTALPLWLAALIVTVIWAVIVTVLAVAGRGALKKSHPELPQTQQTLKEDAQWAKAPRN